MQSCSYYHVDIGASVPLRILHSSRISAYPASIYSPVHVSVRPSVHSTYPILPPYPSYPTVLSTAPCVPPDPPFILATFSDRPLPPPATHQTEAPVTYCIGRSTDCSLSIALSRGHYRLSTIDSRVRHSTIHIKVSRSRRPDSFTL
ncbi:hypothetical protein C8T65DRAFT_81365 [Cerioporus squamosus]|nr:hypothetical protein C8T65DRAFT_81365 [Cerioporus squamosus]